MRKFVFDVESTSTCDLVKAGAALYWAHPDTQVICVCYAVDDGPVITWRPGDPIPYFVPELGHGGWTVCAHNWLFEYNCWIQHLGPKYGWVLPYMRYWDCTMARALYWGLPAGLIDVCAALDLPVQIGAAKKTRIKRMGRPRCLAPLTWWHETDPDKLQELIEDCVRDVEAERALDKALPPLPTREREIFLIDGEINQRGILTDQAMIEKLEALTKAEGKRLNADMERLTGGRARTTNQVAVIMDVLAGMGCPVPSLAKADVKDTLAALPPALPQINAWPANATRGILECRQEAAKASTAKLGAMQKGAGADHRCRGLFQYGGAGRTLRWAGRRVQPQNYPRGTVKNISSVFGMLEQGVTEIDDLRALLPGTVMDAVSSMLRGCFIASPGKVLVSGDLSQIEARIVAWLAGQNDILQAYASGVDVYMLDANNVGSNNRNLGKAERLGLGFGMAGAKFVEAAAGYGVTLTLAQAEEVVAKWRADNAKIVSFWWDVDRAAKLVSSGLHGTTAQVGRIIFRKTKKAMRVVLPSGREITYQNVEIGMDEFGRDSLSYMGVNPKTKKWDRIRTYGGRLVENIVQATARDVMGEAMITLRRASGKAVCVPDLIGTVHDELLGEAPEAFADGALVMMLTALRTTPSWAEGLPVNAEGWTGHRYRK